jgi:hypothetical protein
MIDGALSDWLRIGKVDPPCWCPVFSYGVAAVAAGEPAHSKPHGIKFLHLNLPASYRKTTQHFDAQKASDLLAFAKPISPRFFRTPGRDVALATRQR